MNSTSSEQPFTLHAVPLPAVLPDTVGHGMVSSDSLALEHFKDLVGQPLTVIGANAATPFIVSEVEEKPKSQYPGQKRMPFHLILRSPLHITLEGYHFDLRHPQLGILPYIMLSRTITYPDQPPGAYYEIIFS